jgi:tetratricopeptide (TPR) repeat protein
VSLGCLILVFIFNIQPARANMRTLAAMSAMSQNPVLGVDVMKQALAFNSPHIDDIRSDLGRLGIQVISQLPADTPVVEEITKLVVDSLEKNIVLHPRDIRNYMLFSQIDQLRFAASNDARFVLDAERHLTEAIKYSPKRQQLIYLLASIQLQLGKRAEAIAAIEGAIADNPKIHESYWRLAYSYELTGDNSKAREIIDDALADGVEFDERGKEIIITFYPDAAFRED